MKTTTATETNIFQAAQDASIKLDNAKAHLASLEANATRLLATGRGPVQAWELDEARSAVKFAQEDSDAANAAAWGA